MKDLIIKILGGKTNKEYEDMFKFLVKKYTGKEDECPDCKYDGKSGNH